MSIMPVKIGYSTRLGYFIREIARVKALIAISVIVAAYRAHRTNILPKEIFAINFSESNSAATITKKRINPFTENKVCSGNRTLKA